MIHLLWYTEYSLDYETWSNWTSFQLISKEGEEGIEALLTLLENEKKEFEIGDTLQVKGRLSFYKEEWKLFANFARTASFTINLLPE